MKLRFKLNKELASDKRSILYQRLKLSFEPAGEWDWIYLTDYDDTYVYFEVYEYDSSAYLNYRATYTYDGTSATFGTDLEEVVKKSEYLPVESGSSVEKSLGEKVVETLDKYFGGSKESPLPVIKELNEEQMIAVEPLYIAAGEVDGQGETIDQEGVDQLVKAVNDGIKSGDLKSNYFHKVETEDFHFVKSWVNPCDCLIGETEVPQGMPLIEVQYINKAAWEKRKSGELMGLSIEGTADIEEL